MPISWTLHANKRLVYVTVTRPYTRDQGRAVVRALTAHPEFAGGFGFVIELIGGSDSAFTRDVQYFLTTHKETFSNSRIAIVITLGSRGAGGCAARNARGGSGTPDGGPGSPHVPRSRTVALARRLIRMDHRLALDTGPPLRLLLPVRVSSPETVVALAKSLLTAFPRVNRAPLAEAAQKHHPGVAAAASIHFPDLRHANIGSLGQVTLVRVIQIDRRRSARRSRSCH
jgi:hypothetical protein